MGELERLIAEQAEDMKYGGKVWPEHHLVQHMGGIEAILDQDGRPVREGLKDGKRLGDLRMWKLKTATYTPFRGCRKYPKAHGQKYMIDQGGTRRCGRCNQEYEKKRRVRARPRGPQCDHSITEWKRRTDHPNQWRCMECNRINAREWRERKKRDGKSSR